jgi:hypothetical protein
MAFAPSAAASAPAMPNAASACSMAYRAIAIAFSVVVFEIAVSSSAEAAAYFVHRDHPFRVIVITRFAPPLILSP